MKGSRLSKAMVGTAATWGIAWTLLSVVALLVMLARARDSVEAVESLMSWATYFWMWFLQGAVLGACFAALLHVASRRVALFRRLTYPSVGVIAALASATVSVGVIGLRIGWTGGLVMAGLGAATAMTSLAIARRAPGEPILHRGAPLSLGVAGGLGDAEVDRGR